MAIEHNYNTYSLGYMYFDLLKTTVLNVQYYDLS